MTEKKQPEPVPKSEQAQSSERLFLDPSSRNRLAKVLARAMWEEERDALRLEKSRRMKN